MLPGVRGRGSRGARMMCAIPASHIEEHHDSEQRGEAEPGDARLPVWHDDESGEQRAEGPARVATDLKDGLREAMLSAGRHARDARRFGMNTADPTPTHDAATNSSV